MEMIFSSQALEDLDYWKKNGNKAIMNKISTLLADIMEHPFTGIGKPEALKYDLSGYFSRRINSEHRIVYCVHDDMIEVLILSLRFHYSKK
ncbi:MAG: Txe/YoeB family addiction module toxin [Parabacteroides sp.]|nr:Txe/YoeB family addiction module toxin [Parabacteroides sp.]